MDTGLRTRILTAVGTGTLLGVLGATGVMAFAADGEPAGTNAAAPAACGDGGGGAEIEVHQAEGRYFGRTALAAE